MKERDASPSTKYELESDILTKENRTNEGMHELKRSEIK